MFYLLILGPCVTEKMKKLSAFLKQKSRFHKMTESQGVMKTLFIFLVRIRKVCQLMTFPWNFALNKLCLGHKTMIYFLGDYFAARPRNLTCLQQPDFELIACARAALTTGVFSSCIELLPHVFAELILVPNYFLVLVCLTFALGRWQPWCWAGDTLTHHHNTSSKEEMSQ